jgi:hypothetical protein
VGERAQVEEERAAFDALVASLKAGCMDDESYEDDEIYEDAESGY